MKSHAFCLTLLSIIFISIAADLPAQAQRARVFVSVTGNDSNPCTAGSPCKTFQAAHDAVLAGGEISVLDTGGYGTLIINKAVSIVAIGVEASIAIPSGGAGITINALQNDKISLRGLTLDGAGVGQVGIEFKGGLSLTVDNCVGRNMVADGLFFFSTFSTAQKLTVSNSNFYDNGAAGILIENASPAAVTASIDRTGLYNNGEAGLLVGGDNGTGDLKVSVTDSVASNNNVGFLVQSSANHSFSNLSLTHSQAAGNGVGVEAVSTNATLWLAQSTVTGNANGFFISLPAVINSYGDNYINNNNGPSTGSLTPVGKQ